MWHDVTDTEDSGRQANDGVSMNALVTPHPVQGTVSCLQDCTGDDFQLPRCSVVYCTMNLVYIYARLYMIRRDQVGIENLYQVNTLMKQA